MPPVSNMMSATTKSSDFDAFFIVFLTI